MSGSACWVLLETRLKAYVDAIGASTRPAIQHSGMKLEAANLPYLRPTLLPAQPTQVELSEAGRNRHRGVYRVDCYYPVGIGRTTGLAMAEAIAAHFKRGTTLAGSGFWLKVESSGVGPAREEPDRLGFPINVEWRADISNP